MKAKEKQKQERWVKLVHSLLYSPAYTALPFSAKALYVEMKLMMNGGNNGNLAVTLSQMKHRGWSSPTTLALNLRQLEAVGLIAKTRKTVGVENGSKVCNLYRLTDEGCYGNSKIGVAMQQPTHDFKRVTGRGHAEALILAVKEPKKKKVATETGRTGSLFDNQPPEIAPEVERQLECAL